MKHTYLRVTVAIALVMAMGVARASAQGGASSSISGTVTDASGAVIPGADIKAKNKATAAESNTVTAENGTFSIPALNAGTYTVTVSLMGFKTVVLDDVVINAGVPGSVRAVLEVGGLEEVVTVQGGSEIVNTTSAAVSSTLSVNQITKLPLTSRSALDFVVNLPGTNTPGGSRDSTINGLPQSAINITLDGMNIQDNYLKTTDGFFARLSPRLDAVEEVTVTTAANGAESAGQGAVQIRFTTRSGTNNLQGSSYLYLRHDGLNANTWFNNRDLPPDPETGKAPKSALRQYQPGTRVGGPIVIPGMYDGRDKAFFFFNYEENRTPSKGTLNRTILTPEAQRGLFQYTANGATQTVDLLALAAKNGINTALDPTVQNLLNDIRNSTGQTGATSTLSDPKLLRYTFQTDVKNYTPAPTARIDYNLSSKHRLTGSFNYQHINSDPDTTNSQQVSFPGFPIAGSQQSTRYTTSEALRSTISANVINEFRGGATGGATFFSPEKNVSMWGGTSVADQTGYHININRTGITNAGVTPTPSSREASTWNFEDTLTWIRGTHSLSMGGAFTRAHIWLKNQTLVPTIDFGVVTGDPALPLFTGSNFPGASSTQITAAQNLYAVLTGRVAAVNANAGFDIDSNTFQYLGQRLQQGNMKEIGSFIQDAWRWKPNLTVNAGLRYELQLPFYPANDSYSTATFADVCGISGVGPAGCNVFQPGNLSGKHPTFVAYPSGTHAYKTDKNNFAPTLGLSYVPGARNGFLGKIIGQDGDTVLRAGYSLAYERHGMSDFTDVFGTNPGVSIDDSRSVANANLNDGAGFPVLLTQRGRLSPPPFPATLSYPFTEVVTGDLNIFDSNLQVPYSQSWTASVGRKITRDVGIDVRYVGTRHLQDWIDYNYNESNLVENGFLNEFRSAQSNLQANIAAGRGNSFAYFGPGSGTSPLPIYLGYLNGRNDATNAGAYTGNNWTSTNFTNALAIYNPQPSIPAGLNSSTGLEGDPARRTNAALAGLPANLFRANPDLLGGVVQTGNGGYSRYDSAQIEVRKRMSHGFEASGSYVFGKAYSSQRYSFRLPRYKTLQTSGEGGVTHALKANWVYELPFGRGRRYMSNSNGWMDRILGGWEFDGIARIQSGRMLDFGDVRLVGMSADELKKSLALRTYSVDGISSTAVPALYFMPKDIVENTVRAFSTNATSATGYGSLGAPTGRYLAPANGPDCISNTATTAGQCGVRSLVITGPTYVRFDLSAVKRVRIVGHANFEFRAEMLNAFNHPNFVPVIATSNTADDYRITSLQENSNRIVQLVWRVNW